jgi:hypothetical protein
LEPGGSAERLSCGQCGVTLHLAPATVKEWLSGRYGLPRCRSCVARDHIGPPEAEHFEYWLSMPPAQLDSAMRAMSMLRP